MNFIKKVFCFVLFQASLLSQSYAQESMLTDFSYLYMEKLVAIAKENYPRNKVFSNQVNIATNNVTMAKASWLDHFAFGYISRSNIYDLAGLNSAILSGYFFNISVSPGTLIKRPFNIKNAKEELKTANADKEEYGLQLETEVKRRYINYIQAQNTLKLISKRLVDTESSFTYLKARYERSEISFKEFNDASSVLTSTQESKISAEANYMTTKFALEELLTVKLEDIK